MRIPNEVIEKAIILVCKLHFGGTRENVNKLINYIYHYDVNTPTLIEVKVKFLRELYNKYSQKSLKHQIEDIEKNILDNIFWNKFNNTSIKEYFQLCFDYYQSEICGLRIQNNDKVLIDIELNEDEKKQIEELLK